MTRAFAAPVHDDHAALCGPWRHPRNMLAEQTYGGHASVHDDETARKMGFGSAPIEGPTHFSQFAALCCHVWGDRWLARGGLSVSFKAAVVEGEEVKAFIGKPVGAETQLPIWMEKRDGTKVLRGTASFGVGNGPSALGEKLSTLPAPDPRRVIFQGVEPGMRRAPVRAVLEFDEAMGQLYPFTLREKLALITEPSRFYEPGAQTPWGGPIIPIEMISVLVHHVADTDPWLPAKPAIDLFVDQEIRLRNGPLMVGREYDIVRTVIALSGSKRTESCWVRSEIFDAGGDEVLADMTLNVASFKDSFPEYDKALSRLDADRANSSN